jgi:hypothetical protein
MQTSQQRVYKLGNISSEILCESIGAGFSFLKFSNKRTCRNTQTKTAG